MIRNEKGFTLLDMLFVCGLVGVLSIIAMPRLLLARQSANAASAISSMRAIDSAQLTFALTCSGGFYAPKLTTLGVPPPGSNQAFLSPDLTVADTVTKSGYIVQMRATPFAGAPASCNGLGAGEAGQAFVAAADPVEPSNVRFFATNVNSSIWENTSTLLGILPEVGDSPQGHIIR
jgi:type II secretory pathway pseudopilin PulG